MSCGPRTSCDWSRRPNARAAACVSCHADALAGFAAFQKTTTRESPGTTSLRSSKRLPTRSGCIEVSPVTFPPGRARLATNPAPTGSMAVGMTIGIVWVACLAAIAAGVVITRMRSTLSRTISAANSGKRSAWPSENRRSKTRFRPS